MDEKVLRPLRARDIPLASFPRGAQVELGYERRAAREKD
jgi:hypothetical protein